MSISKLEPGNAMAAIMDNAIKAGMAAAQRGRCDYAKQVCIKDVMPIQQRILSDQLMKMYALSVTQSRLTGTVNALGVGSAEKNDKIIADVLKNVSASAAEGATEAKRKVQPKPASVALRKLRFGGNFSGHYCVVTLNEEGDKCSIHVFVPDLQAEATASVATSQLESDTGKLGKSSVMNAISVSIIAAGVTGTDGESVRTRVMISSNKEGAAVDELQQVEYDDHAAALAIQNIQRQRLALKDRQARQKEQYEFFAALEEKAEQEEQEDSAELIQSIHRGRKATRVVGEKRQQKHAAVTIQNKNRSRKAKRIVGEKREQKHAAIAIQSRHRSRAATKEVSEKRKILGGRKVSEEIELPADVQALAVSIEGEDDESVSKNSTRSGKESTRKSSKKSMRKSKRMKETSQERPAGGAAQDSESDGWSETSGSGGDWTESDGSGASDWSDDNKD
jgi:hypothetical protein